MSSRPMWSAMFDPIFDWLRGFSGLGGDQVAMWSTVFDARDPWIRWNLVQWPYNLTLIYSCDRNLTACCVLWFSRPMALTGLHCIPMLAEGSQALNHLLNRTYFQDNWQVIVCLYFRTQLQPLSDNKKFREKKFKLEKNQRWIYDLK